MKDRLEKLKDSLNYTVHTYSRHITGEDYHEITTSDLKWLIEQVEKVERYERIIHNIANIDTLFYNSDGTEREWDDKEALQEIEQLVMPIWNEHCEKSWENTEIKQKKKICRNEQFDNVIHQSTIYKLN